LQFVNQTPEQKVLIISYFFCHCTSLQTWA